MKNKIDVALMVVTFGLWVSAIVDTILCIANPTLSIKDSWMAWALYMGAQVVRGIISGSFKEWASTMIYLIRMNRYQE